MPFTQFTNLDFDQIKTSIKDYLRANSNFTDFDFEGSNFSVLIDILAYNTYVTAFNSNMVVNESFLDSATLRENVVSLARNIGYVPKSRTAAKAAVHFDVQVTTNSPTVILQAGIICNGNTDSTNYVFSIPEKITTTVVNGVATFGSAENPIEIYEGILVEKEFAVDTSIQQRFILDNSFIDTSTIRVRVVANGEDGDGDEYIKVDNILNLNQYSKIYLLQEVKDEKYELVFGDGFFGKKLENGSTIKVSYIITGGKDGNGPAAFNFSGTLRDSNNASIVPSQGTRVDIIVDQSARNGGDIEQINSIKYFAPRLYSSQYRAVTGRDYEAIISQIYPNADSVSVIGGEELDPPQFGKILISIKPKNGTLISDFDKQTILSELKNYSLAGINQEIIDLKILHVELDSAIYYNSSRTTNAENLKSNIIDSLVSYSESVNLSSFGGRLKYSKLLNVIDNTDSSITSNITRIIIRRDLNAALNRFAQYELCYGNQFHVTAIGKNIKSTGFTISGSNDILYFTDIPNKDSNGNLDGSHKGIISIIKPSESTSELNQVVVKSAGTIDYKKGEIILNTVNITSTVLPNGVVEVQAFPESNDVVALKDLYLNLSVEKSKINMLRDVIASGDDISGATFVRDYYTSSYSNGDIKRK